MAGEPAAAAGETIGNSLQKAIVSMVRFSSAFALYGIEQVQTAISLQEGEGFPKAMDDFGALLDSMTETLKEKMDQSNRDMVKSAARIAEQVVQQSFESLSLMDPRRAFQAANTLVQKTSEIITKWPGNGKPAGEDKPELAVEVLTSPGR